MRLVILVEALSPFLCVVVAGSITSEQPPFTDTGPDLDGTNSTLRTHRTGSLYGTSVSTLLKVPTYTPVCLAILPANLASSGELPPALQDAVSPRASHHTTKAAIPKTIDYVMAQTQPDQQQAGRQCSFLDLWGQAAGMWTDVIEIFLTARETYEAYKQSDHWAVVLGISVIYGRTAKVSGATTTIAKCISVSWLKQGQKSSTDISPRNTTFSNHGTTKLFNSNNSSPGCSLVPTRARATPKPDLLY